MGICFFVFRFIPGVQVVVELFFVLMLFVVVGAFLICFVLSNRFTRSAGPGLKRSAQHFHNDSDQTCGNPVLARL